MSITPDTKDWTWVLERPCPECGYDGSALATGDVGLRVRATQTLWLEALSADDAAVRTRPGSWSTLEYACHVRDVHALYTERLQLMLAEDAPLFPNWDQDSTAVESGYHEQDPAVVGSELVVASEAMASSFDAVGADQWQRTGLRSDGAHFTVDSFSRYFLHDIEHHVWDVTGRRAGSWL